MTLLPREAGLDRMPDVIAAFDADRRDLDLLLDIPGSPGHWERMGRFFAETRRALDAMGFDTLSRADRVDWLLLRELLAAETRRLDRDRQRFDAVEALLPAAALVALGEAWRRLEDVSPEDAAGILDHALTRLRSAQEGLAAGRLAEHRACAGRAARIADRLRAMLDAWFAFSNGYHPQFSWWNERPYRALDAGLAEHARFLRAESAGLDGDVVLESPIGSDALAEELSAAQIPYSPDELIAAAYAEMDLCRAQMRRAAREMGCGDDWRAALERVKADHVPPGQQPALVRDLAHEAIRYVRENDLVTVPPLAAECWRMEMMPAERQKVNPFFLGGETIIVSYPTSAMEHDQKRMSLRGNNRAFARATVQHELIPGHRLQAFYQERCRPYRQMFHTPFWTEGWTMHWEMLLWERGFARTPADRIGLLFWRQHRCARVIFSLGYHLGRMTAAECVTMLVEESGHERDNAWAEVRRSFAGDYPPLYQCAYLVGGWQMHALYHDLVAAGRMTDQAFHDAVLRENCMPLGTLRALLMDLPLEQGPAPAWRFQVGPAQTVSGRDDS